MPITDGKSLVPKRLATTLMKGRAARDSTASNGSMTTRITVTPSTVIPLAIVSGIITTKFCRCCRSMLPRLIS